MPSKKSIEKWLAEGETLSCCIEEQGMGRKHILALTSERAILFERKFGGRMKDVSDKQWRQLIDVHLKEGFIRSDLEISFFSFHDSIAYHDPHNPAQSPVDPTWRLQGLPKDEARSIYRELKAKENEWKELRRLEQIEREKATHGTYLELGKQHRKVVNKGPGDNSNTG